MNQRLAAAKSAISPIPSHRATRNFGRSRRQGMGRRKLQRWINCTPCTALLPPYTTSHDTHTHTRVYGPAHFMDQGVEMHNEYDLDLESLSMEVNWRYSTVHLPHFSFGCLGPSLLTILGLACTRTYPLHLQLQL